MINQDLDWLVKWYYKHCDADWKDGIKLGTLDNPGWYLKVILNNTPLNKASFEYLKIERSEHDWVHCFISENILQGFGGPMNLLEILKIFRDWMEKSSCT